MPWTKDKLNGSIFGGKGDLYTGGLIFGRKKTLIFDVPNLLLFFLFSKFCNNPQPQMIRITAMPFPGLPETSKM